MPRCDHLYHRSRLQAVLAAYPELGNVGAKVATQFVRQLSGSVLDMSKTCLKHVRYVWKHLKVLEGYFTASWRLHNCESLICHVKTRPCLCVRCLRFSVGALEHTMKPSETSMHFISDVTWWGDEMHVYLMQNRYTRYAETVEAHSRSPHMSRLPASMRSSEKQRSWWTRATFMWLNGMPCVA